MIRTSELQADLATAPIVNAVEQIAVAVPPSSLDVVAYRMRFKVPGALITRPFDPELDAASSLPGTYGSYEDGY